MPYLRPKTRRRLSILLIAGLLVGAGGWLAIRLGHHREAAALAEVRARGMADYAAGNRSAALGELGDYLARGKEQDIDADALLAYGMCRDSVELPGKRNVIEAIGIVEHYRLMRPADSSAAHSLLQWYTKVYDHAEALALANALLATAPGDLDALQAKIEALWGLSRLPEALAESQRLNRDAPTLLKGQLTTTYLLVAMDRGEEAVRRSAALCDAYPGDAHFEMLNGVTCMLAGRSAAARTALAAAAARDTSDTDFVLEECRFLDAAGLYDNARALLARTAHRAPTAAVVNQFLLRVYQDQGPGALLETLRALPRAAQDSSQAQGLRATAIFETATRGAKPTEPTGISHGDAVAQGWDIALAARFGGGTDPAVAAAAYREALKHDSANVVVADWLAGAEAQMGESELALAMWRSTALACPNWARPCVEIATTLETLGRPAAALEAAKAAIARAPASFDAQLLFAGASEAVGDPVRPLLTRMMAQWPDRPEVLPLYASALVRAGKTQAAAQVIENALKTDLPTTVLVAFANVDRQANLSLGDSLEEALEAHVSESPAIALAAANLCTPADASLIFDDTTRAAQKHDPALWELAIDERADSGGADSLADWEKLGDSYPMDVRVQSALSRNPCRFRNRAFWKRTIDRLHALVGEQGLTWRVEQARWILADRASLPDSDKELAEAVTLLEEVCRVAPDWAQARHLLGVALERTGNVPEALDEYTAAADMAPADEPIVADLSRLLRQTGRTDEASAVVRRLAACPMLSPDARRWARQAMLADGVHSAITEGDMHQVETDCRRVLALGPSPDASNDLAYALLLQGRPEDRAEALRLAMTAVRLAPGRPEYRDTLRRIESQTPNATKISAGP